MKCGIIKDLLPSYIDELTGEDSNQAIKEHLKSCQSCQQYYQSIRPGIHIPEDFNVCGDDQKPNDCTPCHLELTEVKLLKSFNQKRNKLIALLCACLVAIVILIVSISLNVVSMTIPYENAQPKVEISEQTKAEIYDSNNEKYTYYWHGIKTTYNVPKSPRFNDHHVVHRLSIDNEDKLVVLISSHVTVMEYLKTKEYFGDDKHLEHNINVWNGTNEIYDFNEVDLVYYLDKNVEQTKRMSDEEILDWIDQYGHLLWNKASE